MPKVRNKDLVLPLVLGWHLWDMQFRQAENITGSFDETAGYVPCGRLEELNSHSTRVEVVVDV